MSLKYKEQHETRRTINRTHNPKVEGSNPSPATKTLLPLPPTKPKTEGSAWALRCAVDRWVSVPAPVSVRPVPRPPAAQRLVDHVA